MFNARILGGLENLASIFLEWLDLRRDFIEYSKLIHCSADVSRCIVLWLFQYFNALHCICFTNPVDKALKFSMRLES